MVVLHIASIENDPFSGVPVAVPKMVMAQVAVADDLGIDIGFVNVRGISITGMDCQQEFDRKIGIDSLKNPYNNPDVVVFHEVYYTDFLNIAKQCKKRSIPYIIVPHGCLTKQAQNIKKIKKIIGNKFLFNSFIDGAREFQMLSKKESAETRFHKKRFLGSNGIRIPHVNKQKFSDDKILCTYIGRIDAYIKGLDVLIDAIYTVASKLREAGFELSIYGMDCNNSVSLLSKKIEKYNISDFVKILGPVKEKEKEAIILKSDVFVQTSRSEGMPMGLLEAMSYGVPCLITKGTGLNELVEEYDAGWCVDGECIADNIAKTICKLVNERMEIALKSQNAIKLIENSFLESKVAKRTLKYYIASNDKNIGDGSSDDT